METHVLVTLVCRINVTVKLLKLIAKYTLVELHDQWVGGIYCMVAVHTEVRALTGDGQIA